MKALTCVLLLLPLLLLLPACDGYQAAQRLYDDLLRKYNKVGRPVANPEETLHVGIELKLSQIVDLNEKNQVLTTIVWLSQHWHDKALRWNPAQYDNITFFYVPSDILWRPDVVLYNNAEGLCNITICSKATVYYSGLVTWTPPAIFKSMCQIDVEWFPFDTQTCQLKFGSWTYPEGLLNLYQLNGHEARIDQEYDKKTDSYQNVSVVLDAIDLTEYFPSVEWDIMDTPATRRRHSYNSVLLQESTFIDISPLHYIVSVLIPCAALSFCALMAFYLPSASSERIGLTISILVAVAVFFLLLNEIVPASSLVLPLIGKYLLFTLSTVTSSVFLTVISLNLYFRKTSTHRMAPWVKTVFMDCLPFYLNMQRRLHKYDRVNSETSELTTTHSPSPPSGAATRRDVVYHKAYGGKHVINYHSDDTMPGVHSRHLRATVSTESCTSSVKSGSHNAHSINIKEQKEQLVRELRRQATAELYYQPQVLKAFDNVRFVAQMLREHANAEQIDSDWHFVSMVFDRVCLWVYLFVITAGNAYMFLRAPSLWDQRVPVLDRDNTDQMPPPVV